ncbi:MAG TPA: hypothetical protein DHW82_07560 [Spirochaetia bacterium]|nr:MAG: hypothetical protein A2Y41_13060 [Spirochaetes bacterium GWB1_36_13]HCL56850.1 hypothetical protein [Spirochaetia bacterium]
MFEIIETGDEKYLQEIVLLAKKLYDGNESVASNNENRLKRIFRLNKPGTKVFLLFQNGTLCGHAAVVPNPIIQHKNYKIATLGFYECIDDPSASFFLLSHAQNYAKQINTDYLVGPLDYATWYDYRFVHPSSTHPVYQEPYNKDYYIAQFENFHFKEIAGYISSITDTPMIDPRREKAKKRLDKIGIKIMNKDFSDEKDLKELYKTECICWSRQFLYIDIPYEEYIIGRAKLPKIVDKDLTFGFYHPEDGLCGFLFGIPDANDPKKETVLLKSIGILPKTELAGLGVYAASLMHEKAFEKGYKKVIHALMRNDNISAATWAKQMPVNKRFSLYGKEI